MAVLPCLGPGEQRAGRGAIPAPAWLLLIRRPPVAEGRRQGPGPAGTTPPAGPAGSAADHGRDAAAVRARLCATGQIELGADESEREASTDYDGPGARVQARIRMQFAGFAGQTATSPRMPVVRTPFPT